MPRPVPTRPAFEAFRLPPQTPAATGVGMMYPSQPTQLRFPPAAPGQVPAAQGLYFVPGQSTRQPTTGGYTPKLLPRYAQEFPDLEEDLDV